MLLLRTSRGVDPGIPLLRSLGSNAHVWLPGASGTTVASLPSNNYLLSDGSTGYSTVDGVDGLTLDAMGALGSELVTNGTFAANITGWTLNNGATLTRDTAIFPDGGLKAVSTSAGGPASGAFSTSFTTVVGKVYRISADMYAPSSNTAVNAAVISTTPGPVVDSTISMQVTAEDVVQSKSFYYIAVATTTKVYSLILNRGVAWGSIGDAAYFGNISVKEYTGTHLTQPTTANKPLVRRGMLNELLNSATPATQSVTCIAAPYTLALYGTGNVVLSGTGSGTLTGTGAADLVVLNFTPTAGSVTFTKAGTVSSFGLFKGTWTAAQILAEGGIPPTTATAASNPSAGKYWWSFNHADVVAPDNLLSTNLGITTACTIVVAGRVNSLAATQVLFGEDTTGLGFYIEGTTGVVIASKNGTAQLVNSTGSPATAGVPFVLTFRLSSGTAVIRRNGVQIATAATALTFSATTGGRIGTNFAGTLYPLGGALGWVVPLPVALSDADCLTVERLVGSQFPGMATF